MGTSPNPCNKCQCGGGQQLPPENGAYRLAQVAWHGVDFRLRPGKPGKYSLVARYGSICRVAAKTRLRGESVELAQQRIQLVERRVLDHQLAAARFQTGLYFYGGAEPLAQFFLEARDVPVRPGTRRSRRPLRQ